MPNSRIFAMGLDGSKLSWQAFDFVTNLIDRRDAADSLHVLHVAAPPQKKNLVPATLRPEQLESGVKDRNIRLEQDIRFMSRDREPGTKAGSKLIRMAEEECVGQTVHPRCLVIGCFGRKENDSQHLGHVPDVLLKNTHLDVFIVKQRAVVLPPKPEPIVWVVGTDNSAHAKHALDTTLEMMGEGDELHVFFAAKFESFAKRVEAAQQEIWEAAGKSGSFEFEHLMGQVNYGDVLCNFAERKRADVLVLGHGGHTAAKKREVDHESPKLGSVTEHCAAECKCALFITKGEGRWKMGGDAPQAQ